MKYTVTVRFTLLTLGAFLVMITLFYCDRKNYSGIKMDFERKYATRPVRPVGKVSLNVKSSRILDIVSSDTFILNSEDGKQLYWVEGANKKIYPFMPGYLNKEMITAAWYDTGHLYILNGNGRTLLRKEQFPRGSSEGLIQPVGFSGVSAIPLGGDKLLLRIMADTTSQYCRMAVYSVAQDTHTVDRWPKREINCDCLSADGIFAYGGNGTIFYVNYYNSRVLKFDSTLKPVTEYATIDNRRSMPTVQFDSAKKSSRFDSPHRIVNAFAAADTSYLYVLSYASASNDLNSVINSNAPLDRYSVKTGEYAGSYHLEDVNIDDVNDMKIKDGTAYLLVDNSKLLKYKFH